MLSVITTVKVVLSVAIGLPYEVLHVQLGTLLFMNKRIPLTCGKRGESCKTGLLCTLPGQKKRDLNKQILKSLGCKMGAVCTHVHIPGWQCQDPPGLICETVVQWAWGIIFLYELATTQSCTVKKKKLGYLKILSQPAKADFWVFSNYFLGNFSTFCCINLKQEVEKTQKSAEAGCLKIFKLVCTTFFFYSVGLTSLSL